MWDVVLRFSKDEKHYYILLEMSQWERERNNTGSLNPDSV